MPDDLVATEALSRAATPTPTHERVRRAIGVGVIDDDAIAIQFWTGTISPWAHTNAVRGLRPTS